LFSVILDETEVFPAPDITPAPCPLLAEFVFFVVEAKIKEDEGAPKQIVHIEKMDKRVSELMADRVNIRKNMELICTSEIEQAKNSATFHAAEDILHTAEEENAYIIFTSGSTGEPKGVPISRRNLNAFYTAYHRLGWQLDENDRMLQMFELTFDVSILSR
jgi:long-subunit acyl-CoA synthetase (AMP-forming)